MERKLLEWATFLVIKNTIDKKWSLNNEKLNVLTVEMSCGLLELLVITYIIFYWVWCSNLYEI